MAQAMTTQAHSITAHATREGTPMENPHASTMASKLRDFTRMNPPVYTKFYVPWVLTKRRRLSWLYTSSRMWLRFGTKSVEMVELV